MARLSTVLGIALAIALHAPAQAAFGDRDCSFGVAGAMTVPGTFGSLFSAGQEPDGHLLARIGFQSTGSTLYRIDAQGTTSATVHGATNGGLHDAAEALLPSGQILFSNGYGSPAAGVTPGVLRILAAGTPDATFGSGGTASIPGFTRVATGPIVQPDGKVIVGGSLNGVSSDPTAGTSAIVRFNANGTPDPTFGSGGLATNPAAGIVYHSIALQADGRIVALGSNNSLSRHLANGQVDTTFGGTGTINILPTFGTVLRVRVQPSGKILVAGTNTTGVRIARYDSTGAPDASIGGGTGYRDVTIAGQPMYVGYAPNLPMSLMPDGRIVLVGARDKTFSAGAILRYGIDLTDDVELPVSYVPTLGFVLASGGLLLGSYNEQPAVLRRVLGDSQSGGCVPTTTTLASNPNPSFFAQSVTLTATVAPANAAGSVVFKRDGILVASVPVSLGVASISVTTLPEGNSTLTADYVPSGGFESSSAVPVTHTVNPRVGTTTALSSSPNPSGCGQAITFTATVTPASGAVTPTGAVRFVREIGTFGQAALNGGTATFTALLPSGTYTITAEYLGDTTFSTSIAQPVTQVVPTCLSINDPAGNSGAGASTLTFTVTLPASSSTVTVNYATADRTAKAGTDYTATSGILTFNPGETSKPIPVSILAQSTPGPAKDFFVVLANPVNAGLAKGAGIGTITYAATGAPASFYVDDPSVAEGFSGVTLLGFTVSLSRPVASLTRVDYATANGTAISGTDYTAQSGTLIFQPGQTQRWVVVPVIGNATVQANRAFVLNLTNANGATITKAQGTGTIVDDDPAPAATTAAQYRLYSPATNEHLYTPDANEYAVLGTRGWIQEGTAYTMFTTAGTYGAQHAIPIYRMYHPGILQHHWTTDSNEVMVLSSYGSWNYEGIPGYLLPAPGAGTRPLFRLMLNGPPLHLWTIDAYEVSVMTTPQERWVYEGSMGEVLP